MQWRTGILSMVVAAALAPAAAAAPAPQIVASAADDRGYEQVWSLGADGSTATNLSNSSSMDFVHDVGPDGTIYFTRFVGLFPDAGQFDLWRMAPDGSGQRAVATTLANEWAGRVSPDGTRLVLEREDEIVVTDMGGTGGTVLGKGTAPAWSPDGRHVVFGEAIPDGERIVVVPAEGGPARVLTQGAPGVFDSEPAFSPDGRSVAFNSNRPGSAGFDVYVVGLDGAAPRRVTRGAAGEFSPAWSPDGRQLLYKQAAREAFPPYRLMITGLDGALPSRFGTFERSVSTHRWVGGPPAPPAPVPAPVPDPEPPGDPRPTDPGAANPAPVRVGLRVQSIVRGGRVAARVRCRSRERRCSGRLVLMAVTGRVEPIGGRRFTVAARRSADLRVRLNPRGRALLRRHRRLAAVLRAAVQDGEPAERRVTLRAAR